MVSKSGIATDGPFGEANPRPAAIAACHSTATDEGTTDWPRILALYDELLRRNPSPVVALNRAVAVARVLGPQAGLDALDAIPSRATLDTYTLYHADLSPLTGP